MTEEQTEYVEGFALSGLEVKGAKNKSFVIIGTPEYDIFQDGDNVKRRLKMLIEFNGAQVDYYPNRTSQQKIIQDKGRELKNWVGFQGELISENMLVGKEKREVIYIK